MGYVLTEILPWIVLALGIGLAIGLFFWWCVWWLRRDRERELVETTELLNARREEVDDLSARLAQSREVTASLSGRLETADREIAQLRNRASDLESADAELAALRARLADLERIEAEHVSMSQRLTRLTGAEAEAQGLRARVAELEAEKSETTALRTRIAELEAGVAEVEALRARIAEWESQVDELDTLRSRMSDLEDENEALRTQSTVAAGGESGPANVEPPVTDPPVTDPPVTDELATDDGIAPSRQEPAASLPVFGGRPLDTGSDGPSEQPVAAIAAFSDEDAGAIAGQEDGSALTGEADIEIDLRRGAELLGFRIVLDDLRVVEGIGPKIAALLRDEGIGSWAALSQVDVETLRAILEAAGARFRMHDPGTWPRQAALLARGQWDEFKALTEQLVGGREN